MYPTILIFGEKGQVAWELQSTLSPLGKVIAVGSAQCDVSKPEAVRECIRGVRPQLIVNASAYTAVDKAESEPELARAINAAAPALMAQEAKSLIVPFIHYSTDYVFDGTGSRPYLENDPVCPLGVYGRTKLEGEQGVMASGAAALIFRTSWVYGSRGHNFYLTMLRLGCEREELRVVSDQRGAPTWSRSIALGTALVIAQAGVEGVRYFQDRRGIYNMAAGSETTWHGFATRIFEKTHLRDKLKVKEVKAISSAEFPTPAKRPQYSKLDGQKLRTTFGVELPSWEEQLAHVVREHG